MRLEFRNCTMSLLVAFCIVCGIATALGIIGIYILLTVEEPSLIPSLRWGTAFFIGLFICVPCILSVVNAYISYTERIEISEDGVKFYRGKMQIRHLTLPQINMFGCAAFMHRNGYTFFCDTPLDQIMAFWEEHPQKTGKLFGRNRMERLSNSPEGCLQLAVGTYIELKRRKNPQNIIILKTASPEQLKEISTFLHVKPILTGPIILDQLDRWERQL